MKCMGDFGEMGTKPTPRQMPGAIGPVTRPYIKPALPSSRPVSMPIVRPTGPVLKPGFSRPVPVSRPIPLPGRIIQGGGLVQRPTGPVSIKPFTRRSPGIISRPYDRSPGSTLKSPVKPIVPVNVPSVITAGPKPSMSQQAKDILKNLAQPKTTLVQTSSPAVAVLSNTSNAVAITSTASPAAVVPGTTVKAPVQAPIQSPAQAPVQVSTQPTISQAPKAKGNTGMIAGGLAVAGIAAYMFMKD